MTAGSAFIAANGSRSASRHRRSSSRSVRSIGRAPVPHPRSGVMTISTSTVSPHATVTRCAAGGVVDVDGGDGELAGDAGCGEDAVLGGARRRRGSRRVSIRMKMSPSGLPSASTTRPSIPLAADPLAIAGPADRRRGWRSATAERWLHRRRAPGARRRQETRRARPTRSRVGRLGMRASMPRRCRIVPCRAGRGARRQAAGPATADRRASSSSAGPHEQGQAEQPERRVRRCGDHEPGREAGQRGSRPDQRVGHALDARPLGERQAGGEHRRPRHEAEVPAEAEQEQGEREHGAAVRRRERGKHGRDRQRRQPARR